MSPLLAPMYTNLRLRPATASKNPHTCRTIQCAVQYFIGNYTFTCDCVGFTGIESLLLLFYTLLLLMVTQVGLNLLDHSKRKQATINSSNLHLRILFIEALLHIKVSFDSAITAMGFIPTFTESVLEHPKAFVTIT